MKTIKRIDPKSTAKLFGLMYAIFGFILGVIASLMSLIVTAESPDVPGLAFGVLSFLILPILYGALGWISGRIMSWFYNILSKKIGGIKIEAE